jgi:hypothetical protein
LVQRKAVDAYASYIDDLAVIVLAVAVNLLQSVDVLWKCIVVSEAVMLRCVCRSMSVYKTECCPVLPDFLFNFKTLVVQLSGGLPFQLNLSIYKLTLECSEFYGQVTIDSKL